MTCISSSGFHQRHTLKRRIGKGAFAQVHSATRTSGGRDVAVKISDLRGNHCNQDGEGNDIDQRRLQAVKKEVAILRRVAGQPHCVAFHKAFIEGSLSYIVMERCDLTLLQMLERAPELTEDTLVCIISGMLKALDSIHRLAVVHSDIKPDNFLCSGRERTVKLCDFGLARRLPGDIGQLEGIRGTAPFMSPEMLERQSYDAKADIWSLGVIAYVLLFGRFPYQPSGKTSKAMQAAILAGSPKPSFRPAEGLGPQGWRCTPAALEFLRATLSRDSSARPSAAALLQLPWMTSSEGTGPWSRPSLRPMLFEAKRAGAFSSPALHHNDWGTVDIVLASLQAKDRRLCQHAIGKTDHKAHRLSLPTSLGRTNTTQAECSLDSKLRLTDSHVSTVTGSWASCLSEASNPESERIGGHSIAQREWR